MGCSGVVPYKGNEQICHQHLGMVLGNLFGSGFANIVSLKPKEQ